MTFFLLCDADLKFEQAAHRVRGELISPQALPGCRKPP
jgi:hypothetical protein